ncbi:GyrI-like domain-containing protein [Crocinitomicaceae bacterium]|nr:GyrI-like domain-containing protein [Crocinitomicaceae bacterium]MDB4606642.1 GyrI-like domain-containing protein [Crocinitomicaceae bacterium]
MTPRIVTSTEKKLIGHHLQMCLSDNKTAQLWGEFGPRIKEIQNKVSDAKISLQIYPHLYHQNFNPNNTFEKWAAVEVDSLESIPNGLDSLLLESGTYAVFNYKGPSADPAIFQYIYSEWLPNSNYVIESRPHFEVLGLHYSKTDINSEEEIWIPIRNK